MRIYVSSTTQDLGRHRQEVITQLLKTGHMPVCMEHHSASDVIPLDECLRDVASSEVYVGIFGWRYGYIPPSMDKSITEMEYRKAIEIGIPKLIFLSEEKTEYSDEYRACGREGEQIRGVFHNGSAPEAPRAIVERHKQAIARTRSIQLPSIIYGDEIPPAEVCAARKLVGVPTSRGYCTGTARVITGLQDFHQLSMMVLCPEILIRHP